RFERRGLAPAATRCHQKLHERPPKRSHVVEQPGEVFTAEANHLLPLGGRQALTGSRVGRDTPCPDGSVEGATKETVLVGNRFACGPCSARPSIHLAMSSRDKATSGRSPRGSQMSFLRYER